VSALAATGHEMLALPLEAVKPGTNYRKTIDPTKLEELAKSLKAKGQLEPACVRLVGKAGTPGGYEIIFGERRWRALKKAGLPTIWVYVRDDLDDATVLELQLSENGDRDDVHELEEAEAYEQLRQKHGRSIEQIAARVQKSPSYVHKRIKLLELTTESRTAFREGKILASVAYLLARVPAALQAEALLRIAAREAGEDPLGFVQSRRELVQDFMLRLKDADFDRGDATLVPAAGTCDACPKRTGNQRDLFADVDDKDMCTDPVCFAAKRRAHGDRQLAAAKKRGLPILDEKAAAKLFTKSYRDTVATRLSYVGEYVDAKERLYDYANQTPKQLAKKAGDESRIVIAVDGAGNVHEVVKKSDIATLAKKAGVKGPKGGSSSDASWKAKQKKALERATRALVVAEVEGRRNAAITLAEWRVIVAAAIASVWHEHAVDVRYRRGLHDGTSKGDPRGDLVKYSATLDLGAQLGLLVEVLSSGSNAGSMAKAFGVTPAAAKTHAKTTSDSKKKTPKASRKAGAK
jgi:ParB/RepB/Spo0J family partition protein